MIYQGTYLEAKVIRSNRFPSLIEWTGFGGDRVIQQRHNAQACVARLEAGENPDDVFETRQA